MLILGAQCIPPLHTSVHSASYRFIHNNAFERNLNVPLWLSVHPVPNLQAEGIYPYHTDLIQQTGDTSCNIIRSTFCWTCLICPWEIVTWRYYPLLLYHRYDTWAKRQLSKEICFHSVAFCPWLPGQPWKYQWLKCYFFCGFQWYRSPCCFALVSICHLSLYNLYNAGFYVNKFSPFGTFSLLTYNFCCSKAASIVKCSEVQETFLVLLISTVK